MALSTTREFGVRHVVNATAPNPEQESQGTREDWANELYSSVANYAALPASGNWVGRRRWVTDLGCEFTWDGTAWLHTGGARPSARARLASDYGNISGTSELSVRYADVIDQATNGMVHSTGLWFYAPIPGKYRATMVLRGGGATVDSLWVRYQRESNQGQSIDVRTVAVGGSPALIAETLVELNAGEGFRWRVAINQGSGTFQTFGTGSQATFMFESSK